MFNISISRNRFVFFSGILTTCVAALVMVGWFAHIPILTSFIDGYATMKLNTAFGFILLGVALLIQILTLKQKWLFLSKIFSFLTIVLGLFSLTQDVFKLNLHLDEILITDLEARITGSSAPGRMSPIAAGCFVAMGIFLLTNLSKKIKYVLISQWLAHFVTFLSFIAIVGYLLNVPVFYKLAFLTSMAVHTAFCFLILSISFSLIGVF